MKEHAKPWVPLSIDQVKSLFKNAPFEWWLAGGFALEVALGKTIRAHTDIDILLLHKSHPDLRNHLDDWDLWVANPPGSLKRWDNKTQLSSHIHDIWGRQHPKSPWQLQIMLDQSEGEFWVSRRSTSIRRPISQIGSYSPNQVPYLVPEIQLFYKAKAPRPKDLQDFKAVLPILEPKARLWLASSIAKVYGSTHPWIQQLET